MIKKKKNVVLKHHKCACFTILSWHYCMSRWSLAYAPLPSSHYGQNVKNKTNNHETFLILNQHKFNSDGSNFILKNVSKHVCYCFCAQDEQDQSKINLPWIITPFQKLCKTGVINSVIKIYLGLCPRIMDLDFIRVSRLL